MASTGGYFFGTVPDGKRVLAALNRRSTLECPMLTLAAQTFCEESPCNKMRAARTDKCAAHGQPPPAVFGSAYTCAIGDTVTAGGFGNPQQSGQAHSSRRRKRRPHFVCLEHHVTFCAIAWDQVAWCAGQGESQGSFEYLVYENVLKGVAQSLGLQPVRDYGPGLDRFFDEVSLVCILQWRCVEAWL